MAMPLAIAQYNRLQRGNLNADWLLALLTLVLVLHTDSAFCV
jgi:hypothetical protein